MNEEEEVYEALLDITEEEYNSWFK